MFYNYHVVKERQLVEGLELDLWSVVANESDAKAQEEAFDGDERMLFGICEISGDVSNPQSMAELIAKLLSEHSELKDES